jgi:hypothetical protein
MKNSTAWIAITFALIAAFTTLVLLYGWYGFIAGCVLGVLFFVGLDRVYRRRANRLIRSMLPGETLVTSGIVSESTYDETPAILVCSSESHYRVHVADSRGSQRVLSVKTELARHTNSYDRKLYLTLSTDHGLVHFAPRNRLNVSEQPDYAEGVLAEMLKTGIS